MICSNVINFTVWHQACPHSPNQTHASGDLSSRKGNPTGLPMRELSSTTLALVPRVQADRSAHGSLLSHQAMLAELRRDKSSRDGGALCVPVRSNSNRLSPSVPPSFGLHSAMHRSVRSLRLFSSLARCPRVLATAAVHMPSVSGPTQRIVVPSARQLHLHNHRSFSQTPMADTWCWFTVLKESNDGNGKTYYKRGYTPYPINPLFAGITTLAALGSAIARGEFMFAPSPTGCYFCVLPRESKEIFYNDSQSCLTWACESASGRVYIHDGDGSGPRRYVAASLPEFLSRQDAESLLWFQRNWSEQLDRVMVSIRDGSARAPYWD
eukprot:m.93075 g.93075  ORF g.93075 m.93075 type:complete len:324 (-) comp8529_c0_seq1:172-1143(-)